MLSRLLPIDALGDEADPRVDMGQRFLGAFLLAVLSVSLFPGCDPQIDRKRLEAVVIGSVEVSNAYLLIDRFEDGNGGGGPTAVYRALEPTTPQASDIAPPAGYVGIATEIPLPEYASWVPVLERDVKWTSLASFTGTSAGADCLIAIDASVDEPLPLLQISAACDMSDASGGASHQIGEQPQGSIILISGGQRFIVPLDGGPRSELQTPSIGANEAWSPTGDRFAYVDHSLRLHIGDESHDTIVPGRFLPSRPAWSEDGRSVVALSVDGCDLSTAVGTLQPVQVDVASGELTPLGRRYCGEWGGIDVGGGVIALNGLAAVDPSPALWIARPPEGAMEPLVRPTRMSARFDLSSDGRLVAREVPLLDASCQGIPRIEVSSVADGSSSVVSAADSYASEPVWSPDGAYLAYLEVSAVEGGTSCDLTGEARVVVLNLSSGSREMVATIQAPGELVAWVSGSV